MKLYSLYGIKKRNLKHKIIFKIFEIFFLTTVSYVLHLRIPLKKESNTENEDMIPKFRTALESGMDALKFYASFEDEPEVDDGEVNSPSFHPPLLNCQN